MKTSVYFFCSLFFLCLAGGCSKVNTTNQTFFDQDSIRLSESLVVNQLVDGTFFVIEYTQGKRQTVRLVSPLTEGIQIVNRDFALLEGNGYLLVPITGIPSVLGQISIPMAITDMTTGSILYDTPLTVNVKENSLTLDLSSQNLTSVNSVQSISYQVIPADATVMIRNTTGKLTASVDMNNQTVTITPEATFTGGSVSVYVLSTGINSLEKVIRLSTYGGGEGTSSSPFVISLPEHLERVSRGLTNYFIQSADIDLSAYPNWTPIGDEALSKSFSGSYNGGGFEISNLTINAPLGRHLGLFGNSSGRLTNLSLTNANITGADACGVLAGVAKGGTIKNITAQGTVTASQDNAGGLIGINYGTVSECAADVTVSAATIAGGFAGTSNQQINYCLARGSVTLTDTGGTYAGGFIGNNNNYISNCYATGNVTGYNTLGGFAGTCVVGINKCYASGEVTSLNASPTSNDFIGGFVGSLVSSANVYNCITMSPKVYHTNYIGNLFSRFCGIQPSGTFLTNNYALNTLIIEVKPLDNPTQAIAAKDATEAQLTSAAFYTGLQFDFKTIWKMPFNIGYPILM